VFSASGNFTEPGKELIASLLVNNEVRCSPRAMSADDLVLTATCRTGYVEKGRKCARLPSETVCAKAEVQIGGRTMRFRSSQYLLSLRVLPHPREMSGCMIRLVRVHSSTLPRPITAILPLKAAGAGKYVLRLQCPNSTSCTFPNVGELVIRHARLVTCPKAFLLEGGTCKQLPMLRMLLVPRDALTVDVMKTRTDTVNNVTLLLQLVRGQFSVQWNSSCAAPWASCGASGILAPSSTSAATAVVTIQLNASGQYDDSVGSGLLRTNVTFQTSIAGLQNDIQLSFPGRYLSSPIRMRVVSHPYILHDDISLTTIDSGGLWEKSEKRSLPPKGEFLTVEWGLSIRLQVCACVCCQRPPTT